LRGPIPPYSHYLFASGKAKDHPLENNEPGGKMVWYPREMKRTNVSGVYPSSAGGGLGQDYREEE
jgi:hypothetical protein